MSTPPDPSPTPPESRASASDCTRPGVTVPQPTESGAADPDSVSVPGPGPECPDAPTDDAGPNQSAVRQSERSPAQPPQTVAAWIALLTVLYGAALSAFNLAAWVGCQLVSDWVRIVPLEMTARTGDQLPAADVEALAALEGALRQHAESLGTYAMTSSALGAGIAIAALGLLYGSRLGRGALRLLLAARVVQVVLIGVLLGAAVAQTLIETLVHYEDLAVRLIGPTAVLPMDVRPWLDDSPGLRRAALGATALLALPPLALFRLASLAPVRRWCAWGSKSA